MGAIRREYERHGVRAFYERFGRGYRNPHEAAVQRALAAAVQAWQPDLSRVLDLACGSGEITLGLRALGCGAVEGVDPYTAEAYRERTGQPALACSFEEIAAGALAGRAYSLIVCSYALHLLEASRLPGLLYQLAGIAPALLVLSPHKRPQLKPAWGWALAGEQVVDRVRVRYYRREAPASDLPAASPGESA